MPPSPPSSYSHPHHPKFRLSLKEPFASGLPSFSLLNWYLVSTPSGDRISFVSWNLNFYFINYTLLIFKNVLLIKLIFQYLKGTFRRHCSPWHKISTYDFAWNMRSNTNVLELEIKIRGGVVLWCCEGRPSTTSTDCSSYSVISFTQERKHRVHAEFFQNWKYAMDCY